MEDISAEEKTPALKLNHIDLHFHSGNERQPGKTLADYLEHACKPGGGTLE